MSSRTPSPDDRNRNDEDDAFYDRHQYGAPSSRTSRERGEQFDGSVLPWQNESPSTVRREQHRGRARRDVVTASSVRLESRDAILDDGRIPAPRPRPSRPMPDVRRAPSRSDRVISQRTVDGLQDDVRSVRHAPTARTRRRAQRSGAWVWQPIVLPQARQVLEQALPCLISGLTVMATAFALPFIPAALPVWAPLLLIPTLAMMVFADGRRHTHLQRASIVNFATIGVFLPLVIMRQSFVRVAFLEWGNGTLTMPVLGTLAVVGTMVGLALLSALVSQEDPEYSGILFAPVAFLIPFFAGASEIVALRPSLLILGGVFLASAVLTTVASILPGAYPTLVAPLALAAVFFVLPLWQNAAIFPVGAGMSAKLLFFTVLVAAVGLTVSIPVIAVWMQDVRKIVASREALAPRTVVR